MEKDHLDPNDNPQRIVIEKTNKQIIDETQNERFSKYYDVAKTISSINRELSLAGVAIVWMFRTELIKQGNEACRLNVLLVALVCFIASIILDLVMNIWMLKTYEKYATTDLVKINKDKETDKAIETVNPIAEEHYKLNRYMWDGRIMLMLLGYLLIVFSVSNIIIII